MIQTENKTKVTPVKKATQNNLQQSLTKNNRSPKMSKEKTPVKTPVKYEEKASSKEKAPLKISDSKVKVSPNKSTTENESIDTDAKVDEKTTVSINEVKKRKGRTKQTTNYPLRRIRMVMNSAYAGNISGGAVPLTAKAAELFTKELVKGSYTEAVRLKKKKIDYTSLANYANSEDHLEFLHFLIPQKITVKEYKKQMHKYLKESDSTESEDSSEGEEIEEEESGEEEEEEEDENDKEGEEVITLD